VHTKLQKNKTFLFVIWLPKVLIRLLQAIMSSQTLGNHMEKEGSNIHCLTIFTMAWFTLGTLFFFSVVKFYQKEKLKN
jgi:hypothetical protein